MRRQQRLRLHRVLTVALEKTREEGQTAILTHRRLPAAAYRRPVGGSSAWGALNIGTARWQIRSYCSIPRRASDVWNVSPGMPLTYGRC